MSFEIALELSLTPTTTSDCRDVKSLMLWRAEYPLMERELTILKKVTLVIGRLHELSGSARANVGDEAIALCAVFKEAKREVAKIGIGELDSARAG